MRAGAKMLTWKVWTHQQNDPVFEGTEEQARTYIILHQPACDGAVLESPTVTLTATSAAPGFASTARRAIEHTAAVA
jgi:hypothetical protein